MSEVRLARKGELDRQKEIWKLCFGDDNKYIDLYYANRYKEDETALLLHDREIAAMLTIIPVEIVTPENSRFNSAMLYAIATHPQYQHKGFATQLMDFTNQYLCTKDKVLSLLVPEGKQLFDFYHKLGYRNGFYLKEANLTRAMVEQLPNRESCQGRISAITPVEYNQRRNLLLQSRLYISYADEDIAYLKKLSQLSGADIYALDFAETQGCIAIERVTRERVLIKEILLPENLINVAIKKVAQLLEANDYIVRTPTYLGEDLGGSTRPFGMVRVNHHLADEIAPIESGYLGLAFD